MIPIGFHCDHSPSNKVWNSSEFSPGNTVNAKAPCFRAFLLAWFLPRAVLGPVLFFAFWRLLWRFRRDVIFLLSLTNDRVTRMSRFQGSLLFEGQQTVSFAARPLRTIQSQTLMLEP